MYYYVGQKVSHQAYGNGKVAKIYEGGIQIYPVIVDFESRDSFSFTIDGKHEIEDKFPSLSQQPHVPLELKEIITFEKGELVWVKVKGNPDWDARYYSHQDERQYMCFDYQKQEGSASGWHEIRKFSDIPF